MENKSNGIPVSLPLTTRTFRGIDDAWICHVLVGEFPIVRAASSTAEGATEAAIQTFVDSLRKVMSDADPKG